MRVNTGLLITACQSVKNYLRGQHPIDRSCIEVLPNLHAAPKVLHRS